MQSRSLDPSRKISEMALIVRLVAALVIAVVVGLLLSALLGPILITLKVAIAITIGRFFVEWGWVLGVLAGIWFFVAGGGINFPTFRPPAPPAQ